MTLQQTPRRLLTARSIERKRAAGVPVRIGIAANGGRNAVALQKPLRALRRRQGLKPEIRQYSFPSLLLHYRLCEKFSPVRV